MPGGFEPTLVFCREMRVMTTKRPEDNALENYRIRTAFVEVRGQQQLCPSAMGA